MNDTTQSCPNCDSMAAENARLRELLREVVDTLPPSYEPGELTPHCPWCGKNMWLGHADNCVIVRIQQMTGGGDND